MVNEARTMGFLKKKKKSHQASPSQGGKNFGITISPAHAFSSVFARSPSSATVDDTRNDVGSDARLSASNHSLEDVKIMPASNATHSTINNITMASPLSVGSGGEVRDKPSASASTNATVTAVASIIVPPIPKIAKKKTATIKSEKTQINASEVVGSKEESCIRREKLSEDSCSQSMSDDDDERESFTDDDDDGTESNTERLAMYTADSSNSFDSLGYRNSHSKSTSFGITQSTSSENTDYASTSDEDEEDEREVNRSRQNISRKEHRDLIGYVSETDTAAPISALGGSHSKAKKSLEKLNTLASKAKNESNTVSNKSAGHVRGFPASSPTTKGKEKCTSTTRSTSSPPPKKDIGADSVASTDANSSNASTSTTMFLKALEEYTVKSADSQLLLKVNEHGNVQKLTLQVKMAWDVFIFALEYHLSPPHNNPALYCNYYLPQ